MNHYLTLLGFILISCQVFATCVVVIRTPTEIIVGADSRRLKMKGDGSHQEEVVDGHCKIREAGKFYYGFVGFNDVKQKEYAELAAKSAKNLQEFVKIFSDSIGPYYVNNLNYIRNTKPEIYVNEFTNNRSVFAEMPFFTFENGTPQVIIAIFYNAATGTNNADIRVRYRYNDPIYILGYKQEALDAYKSLDAINEDVTKIGFPGVAKKIIDIESKAHPERVGGPIYVLRLTSDKKEWIDGKEPKC